MQLSEEYRRSTTKNRNASIVPSVRTSYNGVTSRYLVTFFERGRVINRTFQQRTPNITAARKASRLWCA